MIKVRSEERIYSRQCLYNLPIERATVLSYTIEFYMSFVYSSKIYPPYGVCRQHEA